jgi:hypothetical protein
MKKTIIALFMYILLIILSGCTSELETRANDYAVKAFEALIEEVDNYIAVDTARWMCVDFLEDDEMNYACLYYIEFKYEQSNVARFAVVIVNESNYFDGFRTYVYAYSTKKQLDDEYNDGLEEFEDAEKGEIDYISLVSYEVGTMNKRQISKALKDAK